MAEFLAEKIGSSQNSGNENYSTTETVVGMWIDGKPIYRLCGTFTTTPPTLPAMETVIHSYVNGKDNFGNFLPLTWSAYADTIYLVSYQWPTQGGQLVINNRIQAMASYYSYVFEYTKPN